MEPVGGVGFFGCAPNVSLLLGAGFGAGEKTCFVFDHMLAGAEPILLNIEGSAGAADDGWIGLPLSCGTLKIAYDLALLFSFRHIKPPEEEVREPVASSRA